MNITDLKRGQKFWCSWSWRYLWYKGKDGSGKYIFEDAGDCIFTLDEEHVKKLEIKETENV